jgi:hypothetical protein
MPGMTTEKDTNRFTHERRAWSIPELCQAYPLSRGFWNKVIRNGRLRARRCGRRVIVLTEDLNDFLAKAD